MKDCKYCSGKVSFLPIATKLYYKENKNNGFYGLIELIHSSNAEDFQPKIRVDIGMEKISRLALPVNYCPICGKKLK
jgi:hypothetical protein